jgi:anti-sigma regulatory factor (Ser/Thr protein kinase)
MLLGVDTTEISVGQQTLEQVFTVAKKSWLGFLDLEISQSGSSLKALPQSAINSVAQVIDEAIGNAWRHGKATEMKISVAKAGRQLKLTAKDNGVGPLNGQKGLGSALYDSVAGSAWSLEKRVGSGTTLTLVISLDRDEVS